MSFRGARRVRIWGRSITAALVVGAVTAVGSGPVVADPTRPVPHEFDTRSDLDATDAGTGAAPSDLARRGTPARARSAAALLVGDVCLAPSAAPVVDGQPIAVSIPPLNFTVGALPKRSWQNPPSRDGGWRLWFYAMRWAGPIAHRAVRDGQTGSLTSVVDQVLRFYTEHPDAYPKDRVGWDEGSSLRRLETLNCLYAASRDRRLVTAMTTEVSVLTGPRYYGPPYRTVHNHGLMANQRIIVAGRLVGRDDWVRLGQRRLAAESSAAFTPAGTTYEQSSGYHLVNYSMWNEAATLLDSADPTVGRLRATLSKALRVAQWFTEPDGDLVKIGDTVRVRGAAGTGDAGLFRDDRAGVLVGRWSWADPTTSYYTLRYGPAQWAHGHLDKASLTWTTRGARVLVGPGYTTPIANSSALQWHQSPAAHNVAVPVRGAVNRRGTAVLRAATQQGAVARSVVDDYSYRVGHRRVTTVDDARSTLNVVDTFGANATSRQSWHLDPAWALVTAPADGTVLRFRDPSGKVLTVSTTGRLAQVVRGSQRPTGGWTYESTSSRVPANEFTIRSRTSRVRTSFSVH